MEGLYNIKSSPNVNKTYKVEQKNKKSVWYTRSGASFLFMAIFIAGLVIMLFGATDVSNIFESTVQLALK